MNQKKFCALWRAALDEENRGNYISDRADSESEDTLAQIWEAAHLPFSEIRARFGLTQAEFSVRFCIPQRTVENWCSRNNCPDYFRLMLIRELEIL